MDTGTTIDDIYEPTEVPSGTCSSDCSLDDSMPDGNRDIEVDESAAAYSDLESPSSEF